MADDAFETVVAAHHAEIRRYLLRITARPSEADDLSQETFLRAFRAHAWLFSIATNLSRNHFRDQKRRLRAHAAAALERPEVDPAWPESEAAAGEARARIEAVIAGLPMKQRLAFIMRKMHDLDYAVIGANLDCSADSARAHVFQALRKIRRGLNGLALIETEPLP